MAPARPLRAAVLWCEDADKWQSHRGEIARIFGGRGDVWHLFEAYEGDLPARAGDFDAYVITGSRHSVNDATLGWTEALFAFLRDAASDGAAPGPRTVGICFGCQALAKALGGEVTRNPSGRFVLGTEELRVARGTPSPIADALPGPGADTLTVIEAHSECVARLPDGAVPLASSRTAAHEAFAVGGRVLGVQCHPELAAADALEKILPAIVADGRMTEPEAETARRSLARPADSERLIASIRRFLEGERR